LPHRHRLSALAVSAHQTVSKKISTDTKPDIASISAVEGKNWRHGDIEDILKQVQCIRKHKWNSMMMKRKQTSATICWSY
jgi:hypothetical protein